MIRVNLMLMAAVLASAMVLVFKQYESRRLFTEIDRAVAEAHRLEDENERLQLERRAQATPLRVEKMAREQLRMRSATPAITQYVSDSAFAASAVQRSAGQGAGLPGGAP